MKYFSLKLILCSLLFLNGLAALFAQGNKQAFYSTNEGLPSNFIYCIFQDSKGFIWAGTDSGLSRFDGHSFRNYGIREGIPESDVLEISEDSTGRIWLKCLSSISYMVGNRFERVITGSLLRGYVVDHDGNAWIATSGKLFYYDMAKKRMDNYSHIIPAAALRGKLSLGVMNDGTLMVGALGKIYKLTKTGSQLIHTYKEKVLDVNTSLVLYENKIVTFDENHLILLDQSSQETKYESETSLAEFRRVKISQDKKVWFYGENKGIQMYDMVGDKLVFNKAYLTNHRCNSLYIDDKRNIWASVVSRGMFRIAPEQERMYLISNSSDIPNDQFQSLFQLSNGSLMMGNNYGTVIEIEAETGSTIKYPSVSNNNFTKVRAILEVNDTILIGTDKGIHLIIQKDKQAESELTTVLSGVAIKDLKLVDKQLYIASHSFSGQIHWDSIGNKPLVKSHSVFDAFPDIIYSNSRYRSVAPDPAGHVWLGNNLGLLRYEDNRLVQPDKSQPDHGFPVKHIILDKNKIPWVATHGNGVYYIHENKTYGIDLNDGLPSLNCEKLFVDEENNIWVCTNNGLAKIESPVYGSAEPPKVVVFDQSSGMPSDEVSSVYKKGSQLFIATSRGLVRVDLDNFASNNHPKIAISKFEAVGKDSSYEVKNKIRFRDNIAIEFTSLDYLFGNKMHFMYRMIGADGNWTKTNSNNVQFHHLDPGEYTFEVKTIDPSGLESKQVASNTFVVSRPFYRSWWFWALIGLLVVGLLWFGFVGLQNQVAKDRLQKEVDSKTLDLKNNVTELEKSNKLLNEYAYIVAHDLKEPLRTIVSYLQLISRKKEEKFSNKDQQYLGYVINGAKRMGSILEDLLDYSRINNQKTIERSQLDLNQIVGLVTDNLDKAIQEKNVEIEGQHSLPKVFGNESMLIQLYQNLIGNSIKFCKKRIPQIEVGFSANGKGDVFYVKDNGIGISKDYQEKIFGLFEQLNPNSEYAGSGMGLAICRRIVEAHGGLIWLDSEEGEGTTFYFTLSPKTKSHS